MEIIKIVNELWSNLILSYSKITVMGFTKSWDNSRTLPAVSTTISTLPSLLVVVNISSKHKKNRKTNLSHSGTSLLVRRPNGGCTGLKWCMFKSWPGPLYCVFEKHAVLTMPNYRNTSRMQCQSRDKTAVLAGAEHTVYFTTVWGYPSTYITCRLVVSRTFKSQSFCMHDLYNLLISWVSLSRLLAWTLSALKLSVMSKEGLLRVSNTAPFRCLGKQQQQITNPVTMQSWYKVCWDVHVDHSLHLKWLHHTTKDSTLLLAVIIHVDTINSETMINYYRSNQFSLVNSSWMSSDAMLTVKCTCTCMSVWHDLCDALQCKKENKLG